MQPKLNEECNPIFSDLVKEDPSFADLVIQFVDGLKNRIGVMQDALHKADFESVRMAAHQLKGSGGGYGYPMLSDRAGQLEKVAKAKSIDECASAIAELRLLCERVEHGGRLQLHSVAAELRESSDALQQVSDA